MEFTGEVRKNGPVLQILQITTIFDLQNKSPKSCEGPRKKRKFIDTGQFIDVWAEFAVQLRKVRKNSHVMAEMQQELLRRFEIKCTIDEVRTKMNNLLKIFR